MARAYTDTCITSLAGIATNGESESARVSAISQLLDRGWGRPAQPLTGKDGEQDIQVTIRTILGQREK